MESNKTAKKAYAAPKLVEYGRMETLTRGPGGGWIDALFGANGGFQAPSGDRSS
jgi:hypothetical protein